MLKEDTIETELLDLDNRAQTKTLKEKDAKEKCVNDISLTPGQKFETQPVRNLRICENTAQYLRNLDSNSAFFDPKSRSMRGDPVENTGQEQQSQFDGDNVVKYSEDYYAKKHALAWDAPVFARVANEHGTDVQQADPKNLELLSSKVMLSNDDTKCCLEERLKDVPRQLFFQEHFQEQSAQTMLKEDNIETELLDYDDTEQTQTKCPENMLDTELDSLQLGCVQDGSAYINEGWSGNMQESAVIQ